MPTGAPGSEPVLTILIVDDEALARARMVTLLSDLAAQCPTRVVGEAAEGYEALRLIEEFHPDLVLLDVQMPGMNGVEVARHAARIEGSRAQVVFATAFNDFAIKAFEVQALDYLLKPVRAARLLEALQRTLERTGRDRDAPLATGTSSDLAVPLAQAAEAAGLGRRHISVTERGKLLLVPVQDVVYFKAELKYTTIRTREREFIVEEALTTLEMEFSDKFIRIHRNALVSRDAIAGCERVRGRADAEEGDGTEPSWQLLLRDVAETLPVSRRQWPAVRALIKS
jgi:two-component system response regulator AlgR